MAAWLEKQNVFLLAASYFFYGWWDWRFLALMLTSTLIDYSFALMLIGVYAFAWQMYGDFGGYSDLARGSAQLLGFHFMINFRQPYFAGSLQDFWRRWHISLSTWLRDYVYIPLGGNRLGEARTYVNLLTTMLLGGLWHGASWTFVIWGAVHGMWLAVERFFTSSASKQREGVHLAWTGRGDHSVWSSGE